MAIQNRETTLPGIWAENAQTDIPTPPVAGVTYRDTTLNSTAIDKAWPFKTIVDSSDFNQHAFLQDTLIKESEQYGVMRWNNTTTYKEGGFCLGKDGKLYQAKRDNQGKEPTASTDDWKVFTSGGGFPIGSIGYTLRTEVPEGGAWCDGAEYTQAMFPDIYQMLVSGKLQSTTYTDFNNQVSTNGYCSLFALNTATTSFKVPSLPDKYVIDTNTTAPVIGNGGALGLIDGSTVFGLTGENSAGTVSTGSFYTRYGREADVNLPVGSDVTRSQFLQKNKALGVSQKASESGLIADTSDLSKVVTLKAYVVLYTSAAEASVAQAAEFMTALDGKANVALDNVPSNIDYVVESKVNSDGSWYRKYKSGWLEQGGIGLTVSADGTKTVTLIKPFKNTKYIVNWLDKDGFTTNGAGSRGISNKTTTSFVACNGQDRNMNIGWIAIGQGA